MLRTGKEIAAHLQVPVRTLDQWRYLGKGPQYVVCGKHIRYRDEDVDAWTAGQTVNTGAGITTKGRAA